jgi:hypothetical protein
MAGPMTRVRYVTDTGVNYKMRMDASNAALVGATAADGTELNAPKGFRPRYVLAQLPNGRQRRLIVPDTSHGVWDETVNTVNLPDFANAMAPLTATLRGRIGERRYQRS